MTNRAVVLAVALYLWAIPAPAADLPYTEGTVWHVQAIRVADGLEDDYLESQGKLLKPILDEAKKQGLVLSYRIITSGAVGSEDWNVLILTELKNWAALDGLSDKMEPIAEKVMSKSATHDLMVKRLDTRRIVDSKLGQEVILK